MGEYETYPSWVPNLDGYVGFVRKLLPGNELMWFERTLIYAARVLNASKMGSQFFQRLTILLPFACPGRITRVWGFLWVLLFRLPRNCGHWRAILFGFSWIWNLLLDYGFEGAPLGFHTNMAIVLQHLL